MVLPSAPSPTVVARYGLQSYPLSRRFRQDTFQLCAATRVASKWIKFVRNGHELSVFNPHEQKAYYRTDVVILSQKKIKKKSGKNFEKRRSKKIKSWDQNKKISGKNPCDPLLIMVQNIIIHPFFIQCKQKV